MSGIIDFIKSLNKRIEKKNVLEDIDTSLKELQSFSIPAIHSVGEQSRLTPLKSDFAKKAEREFYDNIKIPRKSKTWLFDLEAVLASVGENLQALRKITEDRLEQDTLADAITARGAHIVRAASAMSFISRYALDLADYLIQLENAELSSSEVSAPPAQQKYMDVKLNTFLRSLADYGIPNKDFLKIFADLPDVHVDKSNAGAMSSLFSRLEIDPFRNMGAMSGFRGNPIFHIRLAFTDWEAKRYHAAKDRKIALELRLIHLKNLEAGKSNPRVEREIEGVQKRIDDYDRYIREVEASVEE